MTDRDILFRAIDRVLDQDDRLLVLHSSLIHLPVSADRLKHAFQAVLVGLLKRGLTLVLPAFTLSFCRGRPFDALRSPSEVGQLADWLLELPGSQRSNHPIYSFVVAGPMAAQILACKNSTTFGADSAFAFFEESDARIIMLGCGWRKCTQFHRYEEEASVPYRTYKEFSGETKLADGTSQLVSARMYARDFSLLPVPVNDFTAVEDKLREVGAISSSQLGIAAVESVRCRELARECRELLAQDPLGMVRDPQAISKQIAARADSQRHIVIAVLGSANLDLLAQVMREKFSALLPGFFLRVQGIPFGQLTQEILNPNSQLNTAAPQFAVFSDRLEDVLRVDSLDDVPDESEAIRLVDEYLDLIGVFLEVPRRLIMLNQFTQLGPVALGGGAKLATACNLRLEEFAKKYPEVHLFDLGQAALQAAVPTYDARVWRIGRLPFSYEFTQVLAEKYAGLMLAKTGGTARLVVVDLDNTLWGGVAGEEGIGGLKIGGDYPGNAFSAFQACLKHLTRRGIALALSSKNDFQLVNEVFSQRPEMRLRLEDFAATRVDWNPKWRNVQAMAEELGLGLGNILFVDDNPVEREQMRQFLPEVKVLELPTDPTEYTKALLSSPYLSFLTITDEDRKRAEGYRARAAVESERRKYERIEDFYASLEIKLHLFPLSEKNISRAEQLAGKTNQFNTTTRRYGSRDLLDLQRTGSEVRVIATEDKFTPLENIGLIVIKLNDPESAVATIDGFMLSCRVLGRGIEAGVLGWARETALARGMRGLFGPIVETPRNLPVRLVYAENGFIQHDRAGNWFADLRHLVTDTPDWLTIITH